LNAMPWRLNGTYLENCNCELVCPCTALGFTAPANYDRCRLVLAFHIASGEVDGVDVSNLNVVLVADTPRLMREGNWRVGMCIDAAANKDQADKLSAVYSGQLGGPMARLAAIIGERLGTVTAPITFVDDGRRHSVKVGDIVDVEIEDFVSPRSPAGEITRLTGLGHTVSSTLSVARAIRSRINAFDLGFSNDGKNGHSTPFSWSA
jgi:hypothetical protein